MVIRAADGSSPRRHPIATGPGAPTARVVRVRPPFRSSALGLPRKSRRPRRVGTGTMAAEPSSLSSPRPVEVATTPPVETGPIRCPRCRTVVGGDYKFCPACAFRLQEIADEPQPPPSPRAGWKLLLVSVVGGFVALGCAALGLMLFAP